MNKREQKSIPKHYNQIEKSNRKIKSNSEPKMKMGKKSNIKKWLKTMKVKKNKSNKKKQ